MIDEQSCRDNGGTWLLCVGQIIITADVYLIVGLLGRVILTHFKFHLENYRNRSRFSPIIYADFYPINETNIYPNSFSFKIFFFSKIFISKEALRISINLTLVKIGI